MYKEYDEHGDVDADCDNDADYEGDNECDDDFDDHSVNDRVLWIKSKQLGKLRENASNKMSRVKFQRKLSIYYFWIK